MNDDPKPITFATRDDALVWFVQQHARVELGETNGAPSSAEQARECGCPACVLWLFVSGTATDGPHCEWIAAADLAGVGPDQYEARSLSSWLPLRSVKRVDDGKPTAAFRLVIGFFQRVVRATDLVHVRRCAANTSAKSEGT